MGIPAGFLNLFRPKAGLDPAHMGLAEEGNGHPASADAAADGLGQRAGQQRFLEGKLRPLFTAADLQLAAEGFGVNPDAHG